MSESEELMSISTVPIEENAEPARRDESKELHELNLRLREQTAQNAELDAEVRYLLQELAVRKQFTAELEQELESIHAFAGQQLELVAEYTAYRRRTSHRVVDRAVREIHRLPWLYRPLRLVGRMAVALASRSMTRAASPSAEDPILAGSRSLGPASPKRP
jgi:hypothetical protein